VRRSGNGEHILVVSFAKEQLAAGRSAAEAAVEAGFARFRPVLMTALAMIIGMMPMAIGLGEGGEQNAPLRSRRYWRLLFATVSTLFFVLRCSVWCTVFVIAWLNPEFQNRSSLRAKKVCQCRKKHKLSRTRRKSKALSTRNIARDVDGSSL